MQPQSEFAYRFQRLIAASLALGAAGVGGGGGYLISAIQVSAMVELPKW